MFEATVVLEDDVVDKFIEKFCYAGADQMHVSKKRTLQTRELLDREIAAPGEQVCELLLELTSQLICSMVGCDQIAQQIIK
jgi:hypothetical protein